MKKGNTGFIVKRLLSYIGKYRYLLVLSFALAAAGVIAELYIPILIGDAIDLIIGKGNVDFTALSPILIKAAVFVGVAALFQWLMSSINNAITYNVIRDVRRDAFRKLQKLPLSYLDSHKSGETLSRMISDVDSFADGMLLGFAQFFTGITTIAGTFVFMLTLNVWVALIVALLTPLSMLVSSYISKKSYSLFKMQAETRGEQTALIDESIGGAKTVQAFSYEERATEKFACVNEKLRDCSMKAMFFSSLTNPCTRFVNALVYAAVALSGALFAISGALTVGGLSCLLSYASRYTKPFNEISGVITELQNALACAKRVFELTDEKEESADNDTELADVKGNVRMDGVSFSYDKSKKLIENLSLDVKAGTWVAVVGSTGSGKTTLINLLMRFYDTDAGTVFVDGKDIREVTRRSLRKSFGMVLQETWLFDGTVRDNIRIGMPEASDDAVVAAAKACRAHSFIMRLEHGYDTVISDAKGGLSGGQMQLLCIARLMLVMPPMLILDEATSSIDVRTEQLIQSAFSRLMEGKTSFVVAHRLSTIKNADIILVMDKGSIVGRGTHDELLQDGGLYRKLYESQFLPSKTAK